jgi:hypothetical protein
MAFINKTIYTADRQQMQQDLDDLINNLGWPERTVHNGKIFPANQIGLTYRKGAEHPLLDATGSLAYMDDNGQMQTYEKDFTEWVDIAPAYTKQVILDLAEKEGIKIGRVRYMKLMPKTGLTVHKDYEQRFHYVFDTNEHAYFGFKTEGEVAAQCYHIPQSDHFYKIDTTKDHFVYNGGWEPRIHLVCCEIK